LRQVSIGEYPLTSEETFEQTHPVPPGQVNKAIKISYAQAMLAAFFGASTGTGEMVVELKEKMAGR